MIDVLSLESIKDLSKQKELVLRFLQVLKVPKKKHSVELDELKPRNAKVLKSKYQVVTLQSRLGRSIRSVFTL